MKKYLIKNMTDEPIGIYDSKKSYTSLLPKEKRWFDVNVSDGGNIVVIKEKEFEEKKPEEKITKKIVRSVKK